MAKSEPLIGVNTDGKDHQPTLTVDEFDMVLGYICAKILDAGGMGTVAFNHIKEFGLEGFDLFSEERAFERE